MTELNKLPWWCRMSVWTKNCRAVHCSYFSISYSAARPAQPHAFLIETQTYTTSLKSSSNEAPIELQKSALDAPRRPQTASERELQDSFFKLSKIIAVRTEQFALSFLNYRKWMNWVNCLDGVEWAFEQKTAELFIVPTLAFRILSQDSPSLTRF